MPTRPVKELQNRENPKAPSKRKLEEERNDPYYSGTPDWIEEPPPTEAQATPTPEDYASTADDREPRHHTSITGVAAESMRSGIYPPRRAADQIPGEDRVLRSGDPDVDPLENEFSGEEFPGATTPTPDQNNVDEIGRAYGITDQDSGELLLGDELLQRRDNRRWELDPRSKDPDEQPI